MYGIFTTCSYYVKLGVDTVSVLLEFSFWWGRTFIKKLIIGLKISFLTLEVLNHGPGCWGKI
jgi:hypothetical protein